MSCPTDGKATAAYVNAPSEGKQPPKGPSRSEIQEVSAEIAMFANSEMQYTFVQWQLACFHLADSIYLNGRIEENRGLECELTESQVKFASQANASLSRDIYLSNLDETRDAREK